MLLDTIGTENKEISGALFTEIYIGLLKNMHNVVDPKQISELAPDAKITDLIVININHTFNLGFGYTKLKAIQETVSLDTKQIGKSTHSPMQENILTFQMLGSEADILGFKRYILGRDLIVLAKEPGSNFKRQLGSKRWACKLHDSKSIIEPTLEGEHATTLVFKDVQKYDAPYYIGDLSGEVEFFKSDSDWLTSDRDDITCDID